MAEKYCRDIGFSSWFPETQQSLFSCGNNAWERTTLSMWAMRSYQSTVGYQSVFLVPSWTGEDYIPHKLPCTLSEWTEGGNIYQENSAGSTLEINMGTLNIIWATNHFYLPADTTITHSTHNVELLIEMNFR